MAWPGVSAAKERWCTLPENRESGSDMEPGDFTLLSPTSAGAVLVGDYAAYWLDTLPSRLKPKTVRSYRELYRLHLAPSFNAIGLCELRRAQVKALLLDKQRQGLSRNTVRLIGSCLSALHWFAMLILVPLRGYAQAT